MKNWLIKSIVIFLLLSSAGLIGCSKDDSASAKTFPPLATQGKETPGSISRSDNGSKSGAVKPEYPPTLSPEGFPLTKIAKNTGAMFTRDESIAGAHGYRDPFGRLWTDLSYRRSNEGRKELVQYDHGDAASYCKSLGGRLPSVGEFRDLLQFLGEDTVAGEENLTITYSDGQSYPIIDKTSLPLWTSTLYREGDFHTFDGFGANVGGKYGSHGFSASDARLPYTATCLIGERKDPPAGTALYGKPWSDVKSSYVLKSGFYSSPGYQGSLWLQASETDDGQVIDMLINKNREFQDRLFCYRLECKNPPGRTFVQSGTVLSNGEIIINGTKFTFLTDHVPSESEEKQNGEERQHFEEMKKRLNSGWN